MNRPLEIRRDVEHSQSRGCWLYVQVGFTAFYFRNPFDKGGRWQGISVLLNAGSKKRFGFSLNRRLHPKPTP